MPASLDRPSSVSGMTIQERADSAQQALALHEPGRALFVLDGHSGAPLDFLKARAFFRLNRFTDCAIALQHATAPTGPHAVSLLLEEAVALRKRDDYLVLVRTCRERAPEDPRLMNAEANVLLQLGRAAEAEPLMRYSISCRPQDGTTLTLYALLMTETGRFDDALSVMQRLSDLAPDDWEPICNMACILSSIGRVEEAANLYRRAVPMAPNDARLRLNHSITMLKSGRMAQGWAEHEWRFNLPGHTNLPMNRLLPNISPSLDLRGKRVLVTQEEGLGDTLMYLRYLPALGRLGAIVHVWGTETLAPISARVPGVSHVQFGGQAPDYDYHCPFISLPRAFSGTPDEMGAPVPYLSADPEKAAFWRDRLAGDTKLKVGLVWAGAARQEDTNALMVDRQRSTRLAQLAPLADVDGVSFYSLQKDEAAAQLPDFPKPIIDLMPQCRGMDDTAALVVNLDLVISVDTSLVHLAGGLGIPVIMMDRINNCWRWLTERTDTPWYPKMHIVRQTAFGDWAGVVSRVRPLLEMASINHQTKR